uniref:hypothetical protein n=1 Tax=Spongiimicrobium salis TaxID=1667022 RepID=UPI00374D80DA
STILAAADNQQLTLAAGNILTLEDGGTVNLTPFLDNTDNQNLTGATLNGSNELQIDIESGSSATVDLSSLEESADITTNAVNLANHIAADGDLSDTNEIQNLSLVGNDLSISGGNTVTLPSNTNIYTDDGTLAASRTLTGGNNSLTFTNINALQFSSTTAQFFSTGAFQLGSTGGVTQISGATGIQLQDNTTVQGNLNVTGTYGDSSGDVGTSGQILSSTATGTNWIDIPVDDDQTASEVNSDTPVDVDGDGTTEDTVEDVIQDIAPIVSKAARIFYPPSIAVDASTNGTFTIDLHAQYVAQYGTPTVGSAGAPAAVPTYAADELYYYVTFADPTVFDTTSTSGPTQMTIDADGMLTYTIIGQPADFNALINVVFVVK